MDNAKTPSIILDQFVENGALITYATKFLKTNDGRLKRSHVYFKVYLKIKPSFLSNITGSFNKMLSRTCIASQVNKIY